MQVNHHKKSIRSTEVSRPTIGNLEQLGSGCACHRPTTLGSPAQTANGSWAVTSNGTYPWATLTYLETTAGHDWRPDLGSQDPHTVVWRCRPKEFSFESQKGRSHGRFRRRISFIVGKSGEYLSEATRGRTTTTSSSRIGLSGGMSG